MTAIYSCYRWRLSSAGTGDGFAHIVLLILKLINAKRKAACVMCEWKRHGFLPSGSWHESLCRMSSSSVPSLSVHLRKEIGNLSTKEEKATGWIVASTIKETRVRDVKMALFDNVHQLSLSVTQVKWLKCQCIFQLFHCFKKEWLVEQRTLNWSSTYGSTILCQQAGSSNVLNM